jgi:hypothetical protein
MSAVDNLKNYIEQEIVLSSWGDYIGIADLPLATLGALKALVDAAIIEASCPQPSLTQTETDSQ